MTVFTPTLESKAELEAVVWSRDGRDERGEIRFCCPAHDDQRPSARYGPESHVWVCDVCGAGGGFLDLAKRLGVSAANLASDTRPRRQVARTYPYVDAAGTLQYEAVRYEPKDFRVRRPDGNGGWIWNLQGVTRVLYNLPDALAVAAMGWRVYVTEGEKDADAINAIGLCATTNVGGGGKWRDEYSDALRGAEVVVIADKDEPGRKHAREVAASCWGKARVVRVIELPGDHVKDASDWLSAGGTKAELERLGDEAIAPEMPSPVSVSRSPIGDAVPAEGNRRLPFYSVREFAARTPISPPWLLPGYIARGAITELVGKVKVAGKTTLELAMCRAIVRGEPFAGRETVRTRVVYLTEQPDVSYREALARADLLDVEGFTILSWHDCIGIPWPEVVDQAVSECTTQGAGLLVVDTLGQWAGIRGDSENDAGAALEALRPLQGAAGVAGLAIGVLRHGRRSGGDVGDDGRGSSAFAGAVDIVLSLRRPEGNGEPNVRILHGLSRFGDTPESLALQLTPSGYVALGTEAALGVEIAKREVLDAAPASSDGALTGDELLEAAKVRRTSGQEAIAALLELGRLVRNGEGKRGSPYRYWAPAAPDFLSAGTTSLGAAE